MAIIRTLADLSVNLKFNSFAEFVERALKCRSDAHEMVSSCLPVILFQIRNTVLKSKLACTFDTFWQLQHIVDKTLLKNRLEKCLNELTEYDYLLWCEQKSKSITEMIFTCIRTYIFSTRSFGVDFSNETLTSLILHILDEFIGYPDCCWGFESNGIFEEIVNNSFYKFSFWSPYSYCLFFPKHIWPQYILAMVMSQHRRLGEESMLALLDENIVRKIVDMLESDCEELVYKKTV